MKLKKVFSILMLFVSFPLSGQDYPVHFTVDMQNASKNEYLITFTKTLKPASFIDLALPAWSPGYYQIMDYGKNVVSFSPVNENGTPLRWVKFGLNTWRIYTNHATKLRINYTVAAERNFVAAAFIDSSRAFIKPAAVFLYPVKQLNSPVEVTLKIPDHWPITATGLDLHPGKQDTYSVPNYDILYDSPFLVGALQQLPPFQVDGISHRFIGYNMGNIDGISLMTDLEKIITAAVDIFGEIPYNHYTFIGIGPGNGGIEQLNSTAVSFTGSNLEGAGRLRTLSFLAHEYFHNFNVKRIRPFKLGPFDYSQPPRTNLLWVSEGLNVYYEDILLNRSGLLSRDGMLGNWSNKIKTLQNNAGRYKQSLAESSALTWENGPFSNQGETVSYYDKGPVVGMLLDIRIRSATNNRKSLDDVLRRLYTDFYKNNDQGFTDEDIIKICQETAGESLSDIFEYIYTTKEIDYTYYFNLAGIMVDTDYTLSISDSLTPEQQVLIDDLFRE